MTITHQRQERENTEIMTDTSDVYAGVDTHRDTHVAATVDPTGRYLDSASFPATTTGYIQLAGWLNSQGRLVRVGVEGTGSHGAGLARHLAETGVEAAEVNRPNRQLRRRKGKTDTIDAFAAARATANGDADVIPKTANGVVEAVRTIHTAYTSAVKARTRTADRIHAPVVTAPAVPHDKLNKKPIGAIVKTCVRSRIPSGDVVIRSCKTALKNLSRRHELLTAEVNDYRTHLEHLCAQANPALLAAPGVGPETAAVLLVAAGDNPGRFASEAAFAGLCGVSPVEASSGQITRHRINRGGNRRADKALWRIAMTRMRCEERSQQYLQKRTTEGKTRREILRRLKRYIAREIHHPLTNPPLTPNTAQLRTQCLQTGITATQTAKTLNTHTSRITQPETGYTHNHQPATRHEQWLKQQTQKEGNYNHKLALS